MLEGRGLQRHGDVGCFALLNLFDLLQLLDLHRVPNKVGFDEGRCLIRSYDRSLRDERSKDLKDILSVLVPPGLVLAVPSPSGDGLGRVLEGEGAVENEFPAVVVKHRNLDSGPLPLLAELLNRVLGCGLEDKGFVVHLEPVKQLSLVLPEDLVHCLLLPVGPTGLLAEVLGNVRIKLVVPLPIMGDCSVAYREQGPCRFTNCGHAFQLLLLQ
ncbi:MAG: hypothetical protein BWX71_02710 [Deltaproteobacteria bacterium ADurb.Bin072]|nr:MAG: hypothetical protein BWX71_02710 [Deltaproteobacteria bacterium ADurb.Bin072]